MATGDIKWFGQALTDLGLKQHNLNTDTLKLGIVTSGTVPTTSTAVPHWGGTGTTNFASTQIALATGYSGPITLANKSWSNISGVPKLRADIVAVAQDASGFSNAAYGIIYNDTDASKRALAYVELSAGGSASNVAAPLNIDWNGATNDIIILNP